MAGKWTENYAESDTGNWNSARAYSLEIIEVLKEINSMVNICYFGTTILPEEFLISEDMKNMAKLKAFKRLIQDLRNIIRMTKNMLRKSDRPLFDAIKPQLKSIKLITPNLEQNVMRNGKIMKHGIDEYRFYKTLEIVEDIIEDVIGILNKNSLIFNPKEDEDPEAYKKKLMQKMIESG